MYCPKRFAKEKIDYSIYLLTDDACLQGRPLLACVEEALGAGVTLLQYRSKYKDGGAMYQEALALKELCDRYHVPLIINDRVDVALAVVSDVEDFECLGTTVEVNTQDTDNQES